MRVPALPGRDAVEIVFPAWAPGSYLVRDFVRHVFRLAVTDARGRPLARERLDKQRWRVAPAGAPFRVRYRVFAFEASVRTSFLDDSHGYWNGTSLFFFVAGELARPCRVTVVPPARAGWRVATALPPVRGRAPHATPPPTSTSWCDAPFEVGTHEARAFTVGRTRFELALYGRTNADTGAPGRHPPPRRHRDRHGCSAASRFAATSSSCTRCRSARAASSTARR